MTTEQRFLILVQTMLLSKQIQGGISQRRVTEAISAVLFIPTSAFPNEPLELIRMAEEYVRWQSGGLQPEWFLDEWVSDDW